MVKAPLRILVGAALLALAGCVTAPSRERAPLPLPEAFAAPAALSELEVCADLVTPAASAWLGRALDGNFDLRRAVARLRQAEALAAQRRGPLLPRVDGQLEATRSDAPFLATSVPTPGFGTGGAATTWEGSVAASYEVDVWGRLRNERSAALLDAEAAEQTRATVELTLRAQTLDGWFDAITQRQLETLLAEQRATSEKFLELTRLRFGLGQVPAQDIGRQKQQVLNLHGQQTLAHANAVLSLSRLEALTGAAPGTFALADGALPATPPVPDPGVPADVVNRRPDVRAAWLTLAAADRRYAAAVAERLPSLRLSASLLSIEQELGDVFADAFWSLGATVAGNIFDGGARRASIDLADARAEEALLDYADTLLGSLREVHDALIRNASQDDFARSLEAQYEEARLVLSLTRDSYRQGQASYLDVLNALLSVQGLERERLDSHRQQLANRIDLCRAAGVSPGVDNPS